MISVPVIAYLASMFARDRLAAAASGIWGVFCKIVATPLGAGIVCLAVGLFVGHMRGTHEGRAEGRAEISSQWDAANRKAEADALLRDAMNKAAREREVEAKLSDMQSRMAEATEKVRAYETVLAAQPLAGAGACVNSADDIRRLRDLAGAKRDAAAARRSSVGLRAARATRPDPRP